MICEPFNNIPDKIIFTKISVKILSQNRGEKKLLPRPATEGPAHKGDLCHPPKQVTGRGKLLTAVAVSVGADIIPLVVIIVVSKLTIVVIFTAVSGTAIFFMRLSVIIHITDKISRLFSAAA